MTWHPDPPCIALPKGWPATIKSALIHAISLAHLAIIHARGWAANNASRKVSGVIMASILTIRRVGNT